MTKKVNATTCQSHKQKDPSFRLMPKQKITSDTTEQSTEVASITRFISDLFQPFSSQASSFEVRIIRVRKQAQRAIAGQI